MTARGPWLCLTLLLAGAAPARAQDWLVLNGIADGEAWSTDSVSPLLSRNGGEFATLGSFYLLAGVAPHPKVQLIFMGELEGGDATDESDQWEFEYQQVMLRLMPSPLAVISIGKFVSPVGTFGNRRLSPTNPLIGLPDGYAVTYPWGVQLSGSNSHFDYRVAGVNLPVTHEGYSPDPGTAWRPALGGGYTPIPELRLGASATWGPYLNSELGAAIPAGVDWKSYGETVLAFDARFSRGYFEFHGELAFSSYEVPNRTDAVDGLTYYLEVKQTWAPRFFTALRAERNDYPFIRPIGGPNWIARPVDVYNGEIGVGYRASAATILKASYRHSWSNVDPDLEAVLPNGYAFALQISWDMDIKSWLERKQ
jgi:hypothetical protein